MADQQEPNELDTMQAPDPLDELLKPIKAYAKCFIAKEETLWILVTMIVLRFPSFLSFSNSSQQVRGLFLAGLPFPMDQQAEIYHKYLGKSIKTLPKEIQSELQLARDAYPSIRVLVIKMMDEVAKMPMVVMFHPF